MSWKFLKNKKNSNLVELDEAGLLSAIWILASNDENPIMTYRYIKLRLNLPDSYDVKELIKKRSELFRPGVPSWRLEEWKEKLLSGSRNPAWLRGINDENERIEIIKSLTTEDVFRSQFRTKKDSLQSPIELIDWGLQHIERLRKAKVEEKEIRWKWLKDGLVPILSVVVALGTVVITSYFQYQNIQAQKEIKEYEVSFKPKQDSYTSFVSSATRAFDYAYSGDKNNLRKILNSMETNLFLIESLIKDEDKKIEVWEDYNKYNKFLNNLSNLNSSEMTEEKYNQDVEEYRKLFGKLKTEIYQELFQNK